MHTPKPWIVEGPTLNIVSEESGLIAATRYLGNTTAELLEHKANAFLMAAAPDILEALRAFVSPWERGGANWKSKITYDTYNAARRAIAKAEGRE